MPTWIIKSPSNYVWNNVHGWVSPEDSFVPSTKFNDEEKERALLPVGGSWAQLKPQEKPVCTECGSDDIKTDAYAVWDVKKQDWVLDQAFEKPCICEKCGGECSIEWVEA